MHALHCTNGCEFCFLRHQFISLLCHILLNFICAMVNPRQVALSMAVGFALLFAILMISVRSWVNFQGQVPSQRNPGTIIDFSGSSALWQVCVSFHGVHSCTDLDCTNSMFNCTHWFYAVRAFSVMAFIFAFFGFFLFLWTQVRSPSSKHRQALVLIYLWAGFCALLSFAIYVDNAKSNIPPGFSSSWGTGVVSAVFAWLVQWSACIGCHVWRDQVFGGATDVSLLGEGSQGYTSASPDAVASSSSSGHSSSVVDSYQDADKATA